MVREARRRRVAPAAILAAAETSYEEADRLVLQSWSILVALWPSMLIGTGLVVAGTCIGWVVGRYRTFPAVRGIAWWVTSVILPILRTRSWLRRSAAIFINNGTVSAVLVALGAWPWVAPAAVSILGINIGIALRVLASITDEFGDPASDAAPGTRWRIRLGVALNLLEPPAIVAAVGLSIGRQSVAASVGQIWLTFGIWVVPLLLIAAAGEGLWLGHYCERRNGSKVA